MTTGVIARESLAGVVESAPAKGCGCKLYHQRGRKGDDILQTCNFKRDEHEIFWEGRGFRIVSSLCMMHDLLPREIHDHGVPYLAGDIKVGILTSPYRRWDSGWSNPSQRDFHVSLVQCVLVERTVTSSHKRGARICNNSTRIHVIIVCPARRKTSTHPPVVTARRPVDHHIIIIIILSSRFQ